MNEDKDQGLFGAFILGGIIGSALTFLYTPYSGKELRGNIKSEKNNLVKTAQKKKEELINKAKITADDLVLKAEQILALAQKYSGGLYEGPVDKLEREIKSLRAAFDAAFNEYKKTIRESTPTDEIVDDIFAEFEDESLPKHEGMRRRK